MRFLLFDRVTTIEPGQRIVTVKCFSIQDEHLKEHFPRRPVVPGAMVLEALLQTVGWLIIRTHEYRFLPLFTMLEDFTATPDLGPGIQLEIEGELLNTNPKGSMGRATARVNGVVVASVARVLFAHFPAPDPEGLRTTFQVYGSFA